MTEANTSVQRRVEKRPNAESEWGVGVGSLLEKSFKIAGPLWGVIAFTVQAGELFTSWGWGLDAMAMNNTISGCDKVHFSLERR